MQAILRKIPNKWSWHYRTLLRIRDSLVRESEEREAAAREGLERGGSDVIDVANDQTGHEELVAEISMERAELVEVEAALDRLRRGTYGICQLTGQPISPERLHVLPWTRLSVAAAVQQADRCENSLQV